MHSTRHLVPIALLALPLACQRPPAPPSPDLASLRTPPAGPVVGTAGFHGGHVWKGIPFAAPPVGALRWRAPQPAERWTDAREALAFGERCPQLASAFEGADDPGELIGSEDCLTLNVYAPAFAPDAVPQAQARLPVMVWIHGGGNTIGSSSFYDGSHLAASRDLVIVTVNYRLGPLGWFRHASLRGDGTTPEDRSGNFGTLDIIAALRWVNANIAAFGGDPGNVTVFGESAGGRNTFTMITSPLAQGLFHRAIVQSGGTGLVTPAEAENLTDAADPGEAYSSSEVLVRLLQTRGQAPDRATAAARLASMDAGEVAALLRGLAPAELFALYTGESGSRELGFLDSPRLFLEETVLPEEDYAAFAAGRYNQVPIITGTNRDENKLFLFADAAHVRRWFGVIPRLRDPERYALTSDYLSRAWKANAVDEVAPLLLASQGPTVYAYRFDWDEEPSILGADLAVIMGAAHAFEIPFVFGHFDLGRAGNMIFTEENLPGRLALSTAMMSYWAQFAYTGDPGRGRDGDLPAWTAWDPAGPAKYAVLDTQAGGGLRMEGTTYTVAGLVAELQADPRLAAEGERCALIVQLANWYDRVEALVGEGGKLVACSPPEPKRVASGG
jgi:para-nitrobenzyl esterase